MELLTPDPWQPARPGHTLDFAFTPDVAGDYVLTVVRTRTDPDLTEENVRRGEV